MQAGKQLKNTLIDEFNKSIFYLENIDVSMENEDEDQALLQVLSLQSFL